MAILNKIRQRSLVLIIVIAMALFSFVLADLFRSGGGFGGKSENVVATINGEDISRDDFMRKVENMQRQLGPSATSTQAMNRVWDQELRKAILDEQYDKLGISIERDQMRALIKQNMASFEEFKNEVGEFDENKLNEFIANLEAIQPEAAFLGQSPITYDSWTTFEGNLADQGKYQMYFNMVKAGITTTLAEAELDHKLENEKVDIRYVQVPYATIPDSTITVSKSEVADYINKNVSKFEVEASRDMIYVEFKEEPTLDDEEAIKEKLIALSNEAGFADTNDVADFVNANSELPFNDNFLFKDKMPENLADSIFNRSLGETYGPYKQDQFYVMSKVVAEKQIADSVKVRHILIPFVGGVRADATVTKTEEEAKKTADSIYNVVRRNRSKFVDLLELSSDKVSNEKEGVIEFSYNDSFAPEFKAYSFDNNVGDMDVVRTDFGYHIIEILDQAEKQRAIKVANLALTIEPSDETIDETFNRTSKFEIAVAGNVFEDIAKENDYVVKPVNNVQALNETIPGLGQQRNMVRWAFEDGRKVGDVKRFNIPSGGYAVAMISGINKKGVMSTEKASVSVLPILRKEKKAKLIRESVSATTLEEFAQSKNQTVQTALSLTMKNPTISGAGREPKVVGAAFGIDEGETSGLIDGNNGVFMIQVTKKTPAPELPSYQSIAERLTTTKASAASTALYNALKEAADIDDNRATFY